MNARGSNTKSIERIGLRILPENSFRPKFALALLRVFASTFETELRFRESTLPRDVRKLRLTATPEDWQLADRAETLTRGAELRSAAGKSNVLGATTRHQILALGRLGCSSSFPGEMVGAAESPRLERSRSPSLASSVSRVLVTSWSNRWSSDEPPTLYH